MARISVPVEVWLSHDPLQTLIILAKMNKLGLVEVGTGDVQVFQTVRLSPPERRDDRPRYMAADILPDDSTNMRLVTIFDLPPGCASIAMNGLPQNLASIEATRIENSLICVGLAAELVSLRAWLDANGLRGAQQVSLGY